MAAPRRLEGAGRGHGRRVRQSWRGGGSRSLGRGSRGGLLLLRVLGRGGGALPACAPWPGCRGPRAWCGGGVTRRRRLERVPSRTRGRTGGRRERRPARWDGVRARAACATAAARAVPVAGSGRRGLGGRRFWILGEKIGDFTVWRFLFGGLAGGNVILGLVASKFGGRLKFD